MTPKAGPRVQTFPAMKLYREDLDKVLSIFKTKCKVVTIADDENVYESLDEMSQHCQTSLRCFHLSGFIPHAELIIRGSTPSPLKFQPSALWIVEPTDDSNLLFLTAKDFLIKRRWAFRIIWIRFAVGAGLIVLLGGMFLKPLLRGKSPHGEFIADIIGLAALSVFMYGLYMHAQQPSFVTLRSKANVDSFWQRNRDKILLVLIGGGISELVHWIASRLMK